MSLSRRRFLALSAPAMMAFGRSAPRLFAQAANQSSEKDSDNILVVVQMSGGNDGLNTVIPHSHDEYKKSRPTLAISKDDVFAIDDDFGLHPELNGFADLLEDGRLGIVQGVGYPNPNRSHFESMDIWHTCFRKNESRQDGWLGRAIDQVQQQSSLDIPALHLGHQKQPFALTSLVHRVPTVKSLDQFRLEPLSQMTVPELQQGVRLERSESANLLGFVQSSTENALDVAQRMLETTSGYQPSVTYPESPIANDLKTIAQLIDSEFATRIYYVEIDGFDTHSEQALAHASLLKHVSESVTAFLNDIQQHGHGDRVLVTCFSEFGRRVAENASKGTDHGTAAPMFLAGNAVQPGLIGEHPDLTNLEQGDLVFHTDFREVYAGILENWLNLESKRVLGGSFDPVAFLNSSVS
ncbi:hypothetical protein KOR42_24910 [Thalassoglobus neptunius]|uniref:DUF1501 domain-containing protein n=1 Tax=Thalassoglobus neptunius TaxID=1938619 RepID=A0A5C5XB33_9PLAN|nr:DUF1501 domain-containing protein [Thalassoglobus neptunius]TWT59102.1 hypothetical protein KOR42_24910 [Thalassoglobus neptunius]